MRKKVFSLLAVGLFMGSSLNLSYAQQLTKCEMIAAQLHTDLQEAGVPHDIAYEVSGLVQEICENAQ